MKAQHCDMRAMEHRWGQRINLDLGARLKCLPASLGFGRLRDVSLSGAFLETSLELQVCSRVDVTIEWVASNGWRVREVLQGHVVRVDHDGVGIEWTELAPPGVCALLTDMAGLARNRGLDSGYAQQGPDRLLLADR